MFIYIYQEAQIDIVRALGNFLHIVGTLLISLILYPYLSDIFIFYLFLTKELSDAISFILVFGIVFVLWTFPIIFFNKRLKIIQKSPDTRSIGTSLNIILSASFGFLSYTLLCSYMLAILLSFPIAGIIKKSIGQSFVGSALSAQTYTIESQLKKAAGFTNHLLNYTAIEPDSKKTTLLNFTTIDQTREKNYEDAVLKILNAIRKRNNIPLLVPNAVLTLVSEAHAKDMLARGYISHTTPEGYFVSDRIESAGGRIYAQEIIIFTQAINLASVGLQDPIFNKIIQNSYLQRVGIGVLDAGLYGQIVVIVFTH